MTAERRLAVDQRIKGVQALAGDASLTEVERSQRARGRWDDFHRGRTSSGVFDDLWAELLATSFRKCSFCEDPEPTTVEHLETIARVPARVFDWDNLLAACWTCNATREHVGADAPPFDPSRAEPLELFGWDEYGNFAPRPGCAEMVEAVVSMYGLHRYRSERALVVRVLRQQLTLLIAVESEFTATAETLRKLLVGGKAWLGPVREYLLRPPSETDALLVRGALQVLPELRAWVDPWLRPPSWAPGWWREAGKPQASGS